MYVTYDEYKALGYTIVSMEEFERYALPAEQVVRRYTQNRISDLDLRPGVGATEEQKRMAEMNQRGVCELIEAFYTDKNPDKAQTGLLSGFSNEGYSESYIQLTATQTPAQRNKSIIQAHYTADQLWRGF